MRAGRGLREWSYEEYDKDNTEYEPYFSSSPNHPLGHELYVGAYFRTYFSKPEYGRKGVFFIIQKDRWKDDQRTSVEAHSIRSLILDKHPDLGEALDDYTKYGYTLCDTNSEFVFDRDADFFRKITGEEGQKFANTIATKIASIIRTLENSLT